MHWWGELIAFVGAFGIGGWVGSYFDRRHASEESRKAREHATEEARATRQWENRRDAYRELSSHLERVRAMATFTEPFMGSMPDPPTIEADDEWLRLGGMVSVTASDAVREAARSAVEKTIEFRHWVDDWKSSREPGYVPEEGVKPRRELEEARRRVIAAIEHAQTVMRDELDSL
jgi:hypothetical protein